MSLLIVKKPTSEKPSTENFNTWYENIKKPRAPLEEAEAAPLEDEYLNNGIVPDDGSDLYEIKDGVNKQKREWDKPLKLMSLEEIQALDRKINDMKEINSRLEKSMNKGIRGILKR